MVETLRSYLANGQRHADTARALGIHPNTLYQRLSRLDAILGKGWLHDSRRVDIELALRIRSIAT
jgi:DNA-binding PucR family transcriptional regulator